MAITDAVIPVAGLGTRLLPATKSQPKEMLPIVATPVVQYVVDELAAAGAERILFVTGRRKRAIEDHFDDDPELRGLGLDAGGGPRILYTRQPRPRGLGDALTYAEDFAGERPVVVALGDVVIGPRPPANIVARLVDAFERTGADAAIALEQVEAEGLSRYGIVAPGGGVGDAVTIEDVVEKPGPRDAPSRLAVAGRYVFGRRIFEELRRVEADEGGEIQLADALRATIAGGGRIVGVPLADDEQRYDVGNVEGYCATFVEFALRDAAVGPALRSRVAKLLDGGA